MQGWIKLHRKILDNELWYDVSTFRLFTFLLLKAAHKDGVKVGGQVLKQGQYIRSYRMLAHDLSYKEGRGVKQYSTSTLKRCSAKLIQNGMVTVDETELGTLFTIVNYASYQHLQDEEEETQNGTQNVNRTNPERTQNNNKNEKNLRMQEDVVADSTHEEPTGGVPTTEIAQLPNGSVGQIPGNSTNVYQQIRDRYMALAQVRGIDINEKDRAGILEWLAYGVDVNQSLEWLNQIFADYQPKHARDKINSFSYCLTILLDKHTATKQQALNLAKRRIPDDGKKTSGHHGGSPPKRDSLTSGKTGWLGRKKV